MSTKQELVERVRTAAAAGPYRVVETADGFDLTIDIVDAQWYSLIRKNGLQKVFTYKVALDESNQRYSITDVSNNVRWSAGGDAMGADGPPTLEAEAGQQRGRVYQKSFGAEVGMDARTHEVGTPVNFFFSSGEGRELIRGAAKEAGWSERKGVEQLIGLWVAAGTLVLLLVIGLALLLDQLLG